MAGETTTADDAVTTDDQDLDADFDAGFAGATLGTTETPSNKESQQLPADEDRTPAPAAAPAAAAPAPAQQPATETPTGSEPKMVQISEEELAALRTRASDQTAAYQDKFDKVFGQVGALKQAIDKLRTETPAGEKVEISEADFKELVDAYPEIGKLTAQGLNKALAKMKGTGGAAPEVIDQMVNERVTAARTEITREVTQVITDATLNGILPRWRETVNTPEFDTWMKGQSEDVQKLQGSDDVGDAAKLLRMYRRHQERPATTPAPAPKPANNQARQRQIAAAVPVRGDGAPAPAGPRTEDDDFNAGFKAGKV